MDPFVGKRRRFARCTVVLSAAVFAACSASPGPGDNDDSATTSDTSDASGPGSGGSGGDGIGVGAQGGGEACVADKLEAELVKEPIDIVMMVDTSWTMTPAIDAVEAQLNTSLTGILDQSGIDYRLILIAGYDGAGGLTVCIEPPLGGAPCSPPPALPANTSTFFQFPVLMGSGLLPGQLLDYYAAPDSLGTAPGGWSTWLRPEAFKVFVVISDTSSTTSDPTLGDAFDAAILSMQPPMFGEPGNRRYLMHSIIGLAAKATPTEAHLANEPLVSAPCGGYDGAVGPGEAVQQVSILTGGLRFPMCEFQSFHVVFEQIAQGIVSGLALACDIPFPQPPQGMAIDPATVQIEHTPEGGAAQTFVQVASPADCKAGAFYVEAEVVHLCPETCDVVKAGPGSLELLYGCDVGLAE